MTDSPSEIAYLVTIKLPKNPDHNPRAKLTDSCAVSDNCTDSTGEHHTYLARTIEEVQAETRHITRIETIELATAGAPSEERVDLAVDAGMDLIAWDMFEDERVPEDAETAVRGAIQHLITAAGVGSPVPVQVDETKLAEAWDRGFQDGDGVGTYSRAERDRMNPWLRGGAQ